MIDKEDNPYEAPKTSDFEQTKKNKFTILQEFWLELIVFFIVSLFVTQHLSSPISRSIESFFGITNLPYKDYILVSTILFIVVICVLYFSIFFLISYVYFKFRKLFRQPEIFMDNKRLN